MEKNHLNKTTSVCDPLKPNVVDLQTKLENLQLKVKSTTITPITNHTATFEEEGAERLQYQRQQQPVVLDIKPHETEGVRFGKCKWFNVAKGWGFITPHDRGQEVFVHQSVIQMPGFRSLGEREEVEFECKLTDRGLEATRVTGKQGVDCYGSTFRPRTKRRSRRIRCYNCGEFANHIATKCSLGPQPKRCHLCKQEDHLFAQCPTSNNTKNKEKLHKLNNGHKVQETTDS